MDIKKQMIIKRSTYMFAVLATFTLIGCTNSSHPEENFTGAVVEIVYDGQEVSVTNPAADNGVSIVLDGAYVTITSSADSIEYRLSGTSSDGALKIYSDVKFRLVLNALTLTSLNGPAINVQSKKKVSVMLTEKTDNYLTDSPVYLTDTTEDARGTFFSEGQLVFSGAGNLTVNGHYKHGIASDDYILISSGTGVITVVCDSSDGFHAKDYFQCDGGTIDITCNSTSGDGIDCAEGYIVINEGNITVKTGDKGIVTSLDTLVNPELSAINPYLEINGGTINITTGKITGISSEKAHGIQSARNMIFNGGNITVSANGTKADALHCAATDTLYVKGGTYSLSYTRDKYRGILVDPNNLLNN